MPAESSGLTFLVVDDERVPRQVAARFLRSRGHSVLEAENLEQALEHIQQNQVHGVVTDVHYPGRKGGLGGIQLVQYLRSKEAHRNTPIVVMSGEHGAEARKLAIHGSRIESIDKPLDMTLFFEALDRAFGRKPQ